MDAEIKAELTRLVQKQMKMQVAIQAAVQIVIQGIASGAMLIFLWRLERTARQAVELVQTLPEEELQLLPRGWGSE